MREITLWRNVVAECLLNGFLNLKIAKRFAGVE
jgi:hypothetical protein